MIATIARTAAAPAILMSAALAQQPPFPSSLPPNTVVGRISPVAGPATAVPIPALSAFLPQATPIPTNQVLGNISGVTATPTGLTAAQLTSLCQQFTTSGIGGCVPGSTGNVGQFLRADGTWASVTATAGVSSFNTRTGAVTPLAGDYTFSLINGQIALTQLPNIANNTVLGNIAGSTVPPAALTSTQLTTLCNSFTSSLSGCVPLSGGGTTNFLRADGTWAPAGAGAGVASFGPSGSPRTGVVIPASGDYSFSLISGSVATTQLPSPFTSGTASGNTSKFATVAAGTLTSNDCVKFDASGNVTDAGAPCGGGGGAVSSVSNSDGTLTVSPTTGAVVASLALGHANTWSGTQTFGATNFTGTFQVNGNTMTFPSSAATLSQLVASGTLALSQTAIASATCTAAQTATATCVASTDVVDVSFNGDPTAITGYIPSTSGMLTIIPYPTTNTVNVKVCNNTTASITPGAITLNWKVRR